MSRLDQPLKLKHGLAAAVAIMAVSITGTAIAGGGGGSGGGGGKLHYVQDGRRVRALSQAHEAVRCPPGTKVVGGGALSTAGFRDQNGMMLNSSNPLDARDSNRYVDDGWEADVDVFENAGGEAFRVYAICRD